MSTVQRPWSGIEARGPYLRPAEAAAFCGISKPRLYALARAGVFPTPVRLHPGGHATVIPKAWLEAALTACIGTAA